MSCGVWGWLLGQQRSSACLPHPAPPALPSPGAVLPFGSPAGGPLDIKMRSDSSDSLFKLGSKVGACPWFVSARSLDSCAAGQAQSSALQLHAHPQPCCLAPSRTQTVVTLQDRKGDTVPYPKPVLGLPFRDDASTAAAGTRDDYHTICGAGDADAGGAPVSENAGRVELCWGCSRPTPRCPPFRLPSSAPACFCLLISTPSSPHCHPRLPRRTWPTTSSPPGTPPSTPRSVARPAPQTAASTPACTSSPVSLPG